MGIVTVADMAPERAPGGVYAFHWLADDRALAHTDPPVVVEAGKTYSVDGNLSLCARGLHGSERALDGLQYAAGSIVCRTYHHGLIVRGADKLCSRHRDVLAIIDAERTLHEFAIWCAEQALLNERKAGREPAEACWQALDCKRRWLDGKASDGELAAAGAAAWEARDAAWAAAWDAAGDAAWAAAWDAAGAATGAVAWEAREAAGEAAWGAAWDKQAERLETTLLGLAPSVAANG